MLGFLYMLLPAYKENGKQAWRGEDETSPAFEYILTPPPWVTLNTHLRIDRTPTSVLELPTLLPKYRPHIFLEPNCSCFLSPSYPVVKGFFFSSQKINTPPPFFQSARLESTRENGKRCGEGGRRGEKMHWRSKGGG